MTIPTRRFRIRLADDPEKELKPGQPRLLTVDNEMVVPVNKTVRDVGHRRST